LQQEGKPCTLTVAKAITVRKVVSFDPSHSTDDNGVQVTHTQCGRLAEYEVQAYGEDKMACADHLSLLIDESAGYWDGSLVPVKRLNSGNK